MSVHLVWFRNDLRITDNKALYAACKKSNALVLSVFISTPKQWETHSVAPKKVALIYASLTLLQYDLYKKGIPLYHHRCDDFDASIDWLIDFCEKKKVTTLFYNRQYELNEWRRDQEVERKLASRVRCYHFDGSLLFPPGSVHTSSGEMYKIYTPFRNAFIQKLLQSDIRCLKAPKARIGACIISAYCPIINNSNVELDKDFQIGEKAALTRLRDFCSHCVQNYCTSRDLPALSGTSMLSPYLAIGTLSPRQCLECLRSLHPAVLVESTSGAFNWLSELIWREFYQNLIVAHPELCMHRSFIKWTDKIHWKNNKLHLLSWQCGRTGYPIVDAAMHQLNQTGWMHNRLRMISACFLVKDLLIDWRIGERYFMSKLLDGDFSSNNGGWQWAASTGTDSAPYFRIFNPTIQSERFDPKGIFIRKWLPELKDVPDKNIHQPHIWAKKQNISLNYPLPVVNHMQARLEALEAFKLARSEN